MAEVKSYKRKTKGGKVVTVKGYTRKGGASKKEGSGGVYERIKTSKDKTKKLGNPENYPESFGKKGTDEYSLPGAGKRPTNKQQSAAKRKAKQERYNSKKGKKSCSK